jgi:hypothetical protein
MPAVPANTVELVCHLKTVRIQPTNSFIGLGLVISMQLVELHGGHMSASSVPGKGSTFTFTMQFGLPTDTDQPESMPKDNSVVQEKQMSVDNNWPSQEAAAPGTKGMSFQPDVSMSPSFYAGLEKKRRATPAMSSDSSANSSSTQASLTSSATAASTAPGSPSELQLPTDEKEKRHHEQDKERTLQQLSDQAPAKVGVAVTAKLYSILVVCSLAYTREATIGHLNSVLDHHVPHTVCKNLCDCTCNTDTLNRSQQKPLLKRPERSS